jgi:hypothetical protein
MVPVEGDDFGLDPGLIRTNWERSRRALAGVAAAAEAQNKAPGRLHCGRSGLHTGRWGPGVGRWAPGGHGIRSPENAIPSGRQRIGQVASPATLSARLDGVLVDPERDSVVSDRYPSSAWLRAPDKVTGRR